MCAETLAACLGGVTKRGGSKEQYNDTLLMSTDEVAAISRVFGQKWRPPDQCVAAKGVRQNITQILHFPNRKSQLMYSPTSVASVKRLHFQTSRKATTSSSSAPLAGWGPRKKAFSVSLSLAKRRPPDHRLPRGLSYSPVRTPSHSG